MDHASPVGDSSKALAAAAARRFPARFDGVLRLELDDGAPVWIDGRETPPRIGGAPPIDLARDGAGICIWRGAAPALMRAIEEERALSASFVAGRVTIAGDFSVIIRLAQSRAPHG
jgi:hypothetical protein